MPRPSLCTALAGLLIAALGAFASGGNAQSDPAFSGEVTDALGALIPNAVVTLVSPERVMQATTNQNGVFFFGLVAPRQYLIVTSRRGFKPNTLKYVWTARTDASRLKIVLAVANPGECDAQFSVYYSQDNGAAGSQLLVRVLDESGRPLAQSSVLINRLSGSKTKYSQRTSDVGEVHFDNLEAGEYFVKVSGHGYHDLQSAAFWITHENQTSMKVEMLKQGMIKVCQ